MPKNIISKKFSQLLYSFNTNDRYADYGGDGAGSSSSKSRKSSQRGFSHSSKDLISSPTLNGGATTTTASSSRRSSWFGSPKLTSPVLDHSFNSPNMALSGDFDIHNEGVSETILAWRHVELWTNKHHSDLNETLNPPVTRNDIGMAEKDLNIEFPPSVVTSLRIHDGQDFTGSFKDYCGLFFGLELMSLDKVVEMTKNWRKVSDKVLDSIVQNKLNHDILMGLKSPELTHDSEFHKRTHKEKQRSTSAANYQSLETFNYEVNPNLERDLEKTTLQYDITEKEANIRGVKSSLLNQLSVPPNAIHGTYAHRDWIPLLTDNSGNHVAVDLSPAPDGTYGQVILFGREFDTKYVVAPTWGDFMLNFAKDLESGNYIIRSDELVDDIMAGEGELCYYSRETKQEMGYFEVMKQRAVEAWQAQQQIKISKRQHSKPASMVVGGEEEVGLYNDNTKNYSYEESELLDIPEGSALNSSFTFDDISGLHLEESSRIVSPTRSESPVKNLVNILEEEPSMENPAKNNPYSSTSSSTIVSPEEVELKVVHQDTLPANDDDDAIGKLAGNFESIAI
ncbi:Smi1 protein [Saccharomycopsis crataegensis]|uniref:Smi1 protein n=1 Tax=Saccharomycopsis crataegensis TaxID=43959 RepID=A0AAV5QFB6_9ASCO|nr:Smi1 protein [Saccharomycopsis crataegensis]